MSTSVKSGSPAGSVIAILMPQAGNSMEEGTILNWRVKPGDRVVVGQVLCEVETDKASVEVEATAAGRIARIVAAAGAVVPVKQPVAYLAERDEDVESYLAGEQSTDARQHAKIETQNAKNETRNEMPSAAHGAVARTESGRVKASPAARKLAAEKGLDLADIGPGSGPQGRILSTDLARFEPAAAGAGQAPVVRRPLSKKRHALAVSLQHSKQTVPHFYMKLTIDAGPLLAFHRAQKPAADCTLEDVILLAVGRTVGAFPAFRCRIEEGEIVESRGAHIGMALNIAEGLVVPVVMNVDALSLARLAAETRRMIELARAGKIEYLGDAVFSVSNLGALGVEEFTAIINPTESGILAVGAVREAVIVKDGAMYARRVMTMTLSADHRIVDGALAAAFMARLKETLEMPASHLAETLL